jgi:hypothetical protein
VHLLPDLRRVRRRAQREDRAIVAVWSSWPASCDTVARMKRPIFASLLLAPALLACVAGSSSAPPVEPAPMPAEPLPADAPPAEPLAAGCVDPADKDLGADFEKAHAVAASSSTVLCTARDDVDMLAVEVPAGAGGHVVRLTARGASQMSPLVEVFDERRGKVFRTGVGKGEEARLWVHGAAGTKLYFRIAQGHGVEESYTVSLETVAIAEAGEPNDDSGAATALPEAGSIQGFMAQVAGAPAALTDWYKIEVTRAGPLKIDVDMSPDIAAIAELYDANQKKVARKGGGRGERFALETKVKPGVYTLKLGSGHTVEAAGKGELPAALTRPYTITTSR